MFGHRRFGGTYVHVLQEIRLHTQGKVRETCSILIFCITSDLLYQQYKEVLTDAYLDLKAPTKYNAFMSTANGHQLPPVEQDV